jgi:hypothetical protein
VTNERPMRTMRLDFFMPSRVAWLDLDHLASQHSDLGTKLAGVVIIMEKRRFVSLTSVAIPCFRLHKTVLSPE